MSPAEVPRTRAGFGGTICARPASIVEFQSCTKNSRHGGPLLSSPADYEEEASFYGRTLAAACERPPRPLLELGSGGGKARSAEKPTALSRAPR